FFVFQAEDGIRDFHVTGVQTCALPISLTIPVVSVVSRPNGLPIASTLRPTVNSDESPSGSVVRLSGGGWIRSTARSFSGATPIRSEERRVGKECRSGWATDP